MSKLYSFKNLVFTAVLTLFAVGQGFAALSKDTDGYYKITSCEDLVEFSSNVNGDDSYSTWVTANAKVTQPIDMSCTQAFEPIGYSGVYDGGGGRASGVNGYYQGSFDGQGFPISNLRIRSDSLNVGLFATLKKAKISNVILVDADIVGTKPIGGGSEGDANDNPVSVGGIFGYGKEESVVENCAVSGSLKSVGESYAIGGIGGNSDGGTIKNCLSTVSIHVGGNTTYVGGILGKAARWGGPVKIESCVYDGTYLDKFSVAVGGILGMKATEDNQTVNLALCFYNNKSADDAVGTAPSNGTLTQSDVGGSENLNTPKYKCLLNGGTWNGSECSNEQQSIWDNEESITNNGVGVGDKGEILFTITFDANNGSFSAGNTTVKKQLKVGTAISVSDIEKPTRSGYTLVGWAENETDTEPLASLGSVQRVDTLYAVWKQDVTIKFNAGSGHSFDGGAIEKTLTFAYGAKISAETVGTPKDEPVGNVFMGWANDATDAEPLSDLGVATVAKIFHAVWKNTTDTYRTVTFHSNGKGTAPVTQRVLDGGVAQKPTNPTANGFTFDGWYTSADCAGDAYDFSTAVNANVDLHAKWTLASYTITYVLGGGTNSTKNPSAYTMEYSDIVLEPATREGYNFEGWLDGNNLPLTKIIEGSYGDLTLTAQWSKKYYTITYAAGQYGQQVVEPDKKEHGVALTLKGKKNGVPPDTLYFTTSETTWKHAGWALNDGGEKTYDLGATLPAEFNQDLVLYPYWDGANRYTVEYVVDYGSGKTETYAVMDIQNKVHVLIDGPEVDGYTFGGWISAKKTDDNQVVAIANGRLTLNANTTITGSMTINSYTITYDLDGASNSASNPDSYTIENSVVFAAPTKTGNYLFEGWYLDKNFLNKVEKIPAGSTGDVTVYAKFVASKNITVKWYDGTGNQTMTIAVPATATEEEIEDRIDAALDGKTPVKTGTKPFSYEHKGWEKDADGDYVPTFQKYVEIEVTFEKSGAEKTETIQVNVNESTELKDVPGVIVADLSGKGITPLKKPTDVWSYNDSVVVVKDADGVTTGFEPVFKKNIQVDYTDENSVGKTLVVEILSTDTQKDIEDKIDAALGGSVPTKADDDPFRFRHEGWTEDASGNWVPNFQKYVEVTVNYKEGETKKTETLSADVANTAAVPGNSKDLIDSLKKAVTTASVTPFKENCSSCTYTGVDTVQNDAGKVTGFEPVFKTTVVYDENSTPKGTFDVEGIRDSDDSTAIAQKIQDAFDKLDPKPVISKADDDPFKFRHEGWTKDASGNWVPNFQKYVEV
ncbi:MAG: InlB B-repeat-containing protein, partial [Fibrobacter sp.]|nr:InlB B-repeat-containing protein [Fibrobacter sp.]